MNPPTSTLDRDQWFTVLEQLADALGEGPEVKLCLIGSAACLFGGMDGRTSRDLDIWKPASDYDRRELAGAAEAAGLLFDPKYDLLPDRPYLQLIDPIPAELGTFEPVFFERIGRLRLYRPPIENLIVSKLIRCEPRDLSDIRFLISHYHPDEATIRSLIANLSPRNREQASENLIYLTVIEP
jgi:hypothetical protein